MPLVNLIQEQRNARRARERQTRMVLLAIIGVGVVSFLTAGFFTFEQVRWNLRIAELTALKEKLQPLMDELDAKQLEIGTLELRKNTLTGAQKDSERWSRLLDYLGKQTPDGIMVTDLKSAPPADPKQPIGLNISGLSIDQTQVGQFMVRLEASNDLENVTLKYTQEKVGPNNKSTQFELNAIISGTGKPEGGATEAKTS